MHFDVGGRSKIDVLRGANKHIGVGVVSQHDSDQPAPNVKYYRQDAAIQRMIPSYTQWILRDGRLTQLQASSHRPDSNRGATPGFGFGGAKINQNIL
jgi:hypothetical protein